MLEALQFLDAELEAGDVLAHELGAGLALAIVVFAAFRLLCADALLTCGLRAVAALEEVSVAASGTWVDRGWGEDRPSCVSDSGDMLCLQDGDGMRHCGPEIAAG